MDSIDQYFARFRRFRYTRTADWRQLHPFNALARQQRWTEERRDIEFRLLQEAWTGVVESEFEGSSLDHYKRVCEDLNIDPIPESITKCKKKLRKVFVNIVDLMQYRLNGRRGEKPRRFKSLRGLKEYSFNCNKYYSKERAKAEMLRELLTQLH
jgi:hypothetical protein